MKSLSNIKISLSVKSNFPHTKSNSPQSAFCFLQRLSTFFNSFLLSSTAFRFLQQLSNFFNGFPIFLKGFPIFLDGFPLSKKSKKSIYGEKYTKFCYSSFVFLATRSPSFVISAKQYLRLIQHTPVVHLCSQQCAISKI